MFLQTRCPKPLGDAAAHIARKLKVSRGTLVRRAVLTEVRRHKLPARLAKQLGQLPEDDAEE